MSLTKRFAYNVFWNLTGIGGARFLAFLAALVIARLLGKEGFGEIGIIQSTIGLLGTFAGLGLGLTTTKYIAEWKGKDPPRIGRIIALSHLVALASGVFMTFLCILASPWLARTILNAPHLSVLLQIGSILLLISPLQGVQIGSLAGFQAFRSIALINLLQGLVSLPVTLVLVYSLGIIGAVISLILPVLGVVFFSSLALKQLCATAGITVDYKKSWRERGTLCHFSLPALLTGSLMTPVTWAANAILVNQPNGYAELGLFNAANQFRMLIIFLPNIIGMATIPLLSEIHSQDDQNYFSQASNIAIRTLWSAAIPLGFCFIGLSPYLMGFYGSEFQGGRQVLSLIICMAITYLVGNTVGQALIGSGKMWVWFLMNLGWAAIFLPLVIYLTPSGGATGLAQAYVISYTFLTIFSLSYIGIKLGRISIQYCPLLALFTSPIFLIALTIEWIPERLLIITTFLLGCLTATFGWRLMPRHTKQGIIELIQGFRSLEGLDKFR